MKTVDFLETIEACDLKVGRYRQLIVFMKVNSFTISCSTMTSSIGYRILALGLKLVVSTVVPRHVLMMLLLLVEGCMPSVLYIW